MSLRDALRGLPSETLLPVHWIRAQLEDEPDDRSPVAPAAGWTVEALADALGKAPSTVRTWVNAGELPGAFKFKGAWRIPQSALDAMLAKEAARHRSDLEADADAAVKAADLGAWRRQMKVS